jgi:hypothetical protein
MKGKRVTGLNYILNQGTKSCGLLYFHSSVAEVSILLRCGATSLDNWFPVFQNKVLI